MARILAVVPELMFASKVQATLAAAGHEVTLGGIEALAGHDAVIADLVAVDPATVVGRGAPVLGFYPHVDVATRERAERAGVELAVPRSRMAREMPALVQRLLPAGP